MYFHSINLSISTKVYIKYLLILLIIYKIPCFEFKNLKAQKNRTISNNNTLTEKKDNNLYEEVQYYVVGECSKNNCDNCLTQNLCKCPQGYAHDPHKGVYNNKKSCDYKMKKQWILFILEFIFPFGVGHFYGERWLYGGIKIFIIFFIILLDIILKKIFKSYKIRKNINIMAIYAYLLYFFLHLADLVLIGINHYNDGIGIKFDIIH